MSEPSAIDLDRASALVLSLTGFRPYRWQERLLRDWFLGGRAPKSIDVPTGLGKTRVMALWLAARALGAPLPRRMVYVVDRRAVVDQATEEAEKLRQALEGAARDMKGPLGLGAWKLPISTLRGAHIDNREWLEDPAAPSIIVGTVDMIGSRLLFGGYGVSSGMRPAHAGLLGADTLVALDEAHLVPPFRSLLRSVAAFDRRHPIPPMQVMALSATGGEDDGEEVFRLTSEDFEDPPVRARLDSPKRLALQEVEDLVPAMIDRAFQLGEGGRRVVVFCNQRDKGAREVARKLGERAAKTWKGVETTALLTGARRALEREPGPVLARFLAGAQPGTIEVPAFLVATSAGEVGIDLDADHMVCDLVAWERMIQRLGRVNRTGRTLPAMVDVFWSRSLAKSVKDDAEDEMEDAGLASWRTPFESAAWRVEDDGRRPAGPGVLMALGREPDFAAVARAASTPEPLRPALTGALAEAWAMTSLADHPGRPRIEPWLRGWIENRPQTRLVWRRVLPVRDDEGPQPTLLAEFFAEFPPHPLEVLEADTVLVVSALKGRAEGVLKGPAAEREGALNALAAVVLSPRNDLEARLDLRELADADVKRLVARLAGRTVVLDRRLGGLTAHGLLDPGEAEAPPTVDAGTTPLEGESGWTEDRLRVVGRRLRTVGPDDPALDGWVRVAGWPVSNGDDVEDGAQEWRIERLARAVEQGDPAYASRPQELKQHHSWTADEARRIGEGLGLPEAFRKMLEIAAAAHDAGKARPLWQDSMGADRIGRPFAKTAGKRGSPARLGGYRHEFGSLRDAEADFGRIGDEDLRELARHLVAAHHGHTRPAILPFDPDEPPSASEARAMDAALRFARLQRQWGPWGLAWWEALLRAADWAASRRLTEKEPG